MEHPFFTAAATRTEALRWLTVAEQLLSARDLMGSKSFATRARDSDPALAHAADEILSVADTLLAGDRRVSNNQHDWYAILRLTPQQGRDADLVDDQYRSLALILNPRKNRFPFAEQAFDLVFNAWSFLSDPSRKSLYDRELVFYHPPPPPPQQQQHQHQPNPFNDPIPTLQQNFIFFGSGAASNIPQPPPLHGGERPQNRTIGASPYTEVQQVHTHTRVEPVIGGSTREPQNFMSFPMDSNLVFGSAGSASVSNSKSSPAPINNHAQESYSIFVDNVASASGATHEQSNNQPKQSQEIHSNVGDDKTIHNVNSTENVGEMMEDEEEDVETVDVVEEEEEAEERFEEGSTFWTACPYCYYMYEYPVAYSDCTMRCQNCKSAFQAVVIPSPPPIADSQDGYFCCWGFFPLGFSMENWEKNKGASSSWTPFSPMFTSPQRKSAAGQKVGGSKHSAPPRIYIDDDEDSLEIPTSSDSDDDDWVYNKDKETNKKAKHVPNRNVKKTLVDKGKHMKVQDDVVESSDRVEMSIKTMPVKTSYELGETGNPRKQPGRVVKSFGKLDLNVEFCNEAEESAPRKKEGNEVGHGVEDNNIAGIGFFEGLDEFLSNLPILNAVGEDKVVKAS